MCIFSEFEKSGKNVDQLIKNEAKIHAHDKAASWESFKLQTSELAVMGISTKTLTVIFEFFYVTAPV